MQATYVSDHGGANALELGERPRPEPGPGQVRIDVAAAGLNYADVAARNGSYPYADDPPFVPGMEAAGRVDAVGPGTERTVGEPVTCVCDGAFAEHVVVDEARVLPVPDGLNLREAAGFPVQFLTAHNCLYEWGDLGADETVLIHAAAGGVGSAAVQLADLAGATVVGTASTDAKLAFAADLGADVTIDYERTDLAAALERRTDGAGVDLVLDGVGGGAFKSGVEALADCGRVVTYGMASGRPGTVATPRLFFANRSVIGYHLGHALEHRPERVFAARDPLYEHLEAGRIAVQIDRTFPIDALGEAYDRLEGRESTGKIVIEV